MWYRELEDRITEPALKAARLASQHVRGVAIELENGSVGVTIPFDERLMEAEKAEISEAIRSSLVGLVADTKKLWVRFRSASRPLYTMHFDLARQSAAVIGDLHHITRFTIPASELQGLRRVYELLFREAQQADFVATTALGGMPALLYLVRTLENKERPEDQNEWPAFNDCLRSKFHLFPGLNWSETTHEKDLLFGWLAILPLGSSVLLFDTGTKGNGVRQMANLIKTKVAPEKPFGPKSIRIFGVVDGEDPCQRTVNEQITTGSGATVLMVDYERVPKMLTEDCQRLIGYSSIRRDITARPIRANAVMEIVEDDGTHLFTCGASVASSLLESVIQMRKERPQGDEQHASFMNTVIAYGIARCSIEEEHRMLRNAWKYGLIDDQTALRIREELGKKCVTPPNAVAYPHVEPG